MPNFLKIFHFAVVFCILVSLPETLPASIHFRGAQFPRNGPVYEKLPMDPLLADSPLQPSASSRSLDLSTLVEGSDLDPESTTSIGTIDMRDRFTHPPRVIEDAITPLVSSSASLTAQALTPLLESKPASSERGLHPLEWLFLHSSTSQSPLTLPLIIQERDASQTPSSPHPDHATVADRNDEVYGYQSKLPFPVTGSNHNADYNQDHATLTPELQELADAVQNVAIILHKLSQQSDKQTTAELSAQILATLLTTDSSSMLSPAGLGGHVPSETSPTATTTIRIPPIPRTKRPMNEDEPFRPAVQIPDDIFIVRNHTWYSPHPYYHPVYPYYLAPVTSSHYDHYQTESPPKKIPQPQIMDKNDPVDKGLMLAFTPLKEKAGILGSLFRALREQTPEAKQQLFLTIMVGIPMITAFLAALGVSQLVLAPIAMVIPFYLMVTFSDLSIPGRLKRSSRFIRRAGSQPNQVLAWEDMALILSCLIENEKFASTRWQELAI